MSYDNTVSKLWFPHGYTFHDNTVDCWFHGLTTPHDSFISQQRSLGLALCKCLHQTNFFFQKYLYVAAFKL